MENLIEHIISDFQERALPSGQKREVQLPHIPGKIDTIIGMRRTGKTYFLYQIMEDQLKQGFPKQGMLYINFDDERLLPLKVEQLHLVVDTYYRMFPDFKKKRCYFFFDEIQNIEGWEKFVRRLLDTENAHIILTGSSAKLLSKEIATNLRGRSISTEIFPFSFTETLHHENPDLQLSGSPGAQLRALLSNRIRQYLIKGGFPEIQTLDDEYQLRILQEYVNVVIMRDVVERYSVSNVQALHMMVRHLLSNSAALFSVNKFYNDLRSQGISCTKNALYEYLDYLHDAYLVYPVYIYTRSERVRRMHPRKMYAIDTGIVNAFLQKPQTDWGRLLENFVYIELRRQGLNIAYYQTKEHTEVDFICTSIQGERNLYQVALNLNDPETREREINALEMAMHECGLKEAKIITLDHRETVTVKSGKIEIIPAWQRVFK